VLRPRGDREYGAGSRAESVSWPVPIGSFSVRVLGCQLRKRRAPVVCNRRGSSGPVSPPRWRSGCRELGTSAAALRKLAQRPGSPGEPGESGHRCAPAAGVELAPRPDPGPYPAQRAEKSSSLPSGPGYHHRLRGPATWGAIRVQTRPSRFAGCDCLKLPVGRREGSMLSVGAERARRGGLGMLVLRHRGQELPGQWVLCVCQRR